MANNHSITIIGSGNVAWHLSFVFQKAGIYISKIISRNPENAHRLAKETGAEFGNDVTSLPKHTSLVLLCISDGSVAEVFSKIRKFGYPVAHTGGSLPLSVFGEKYSMAGVFYPFQTFTKDIRLGEVRFPVCIEAASAGMENMLFNLASRVSKTVVGLNSEKRRMLHLSGAIANNFTNFLWKGAFDLLEKNDIDRNLLLPLLDETAAKIQHSKPEFLQTGPARRGDVKTIKQHLALLEKHPDLYELYRMFSDKILKYYNANNGSF